MCGKTRRSRTYLAEAVSVTLVFHADKFTRQTRFKVRSSVLPHRLARERHKEMASPNQGVRVPNTRCDRVFIDCLGQCDLMSPGYPGFYPRNVTCVYSIIFNNSDTRVTLGGHYLDKFDVWGAPGFQGHRLSSSFCPHDRLRVYEDRYVLPKTSGGQNDRNFIGQFCGRGTLPRIVSKGNRVTVVFVSSPAGTPFSDGFRLSVGSERRPTSGLSSRVTSNKWGQEMLSNGSCDWWLNSDEVQQGVISSLRHWYPPGTKCSFNFRGKSGEKIWIHFQGFSSHRNIGTGNRGGCPDRLRIYDSDCEDKDKLVGDFCAGSSRRPNETLTSSGDKAYVVFESVDGSHDGSQFDFSAYFMFFNGTPPETAVPGTACDQIFDVRTSRNGQFDLLPDRLQLRRQQLECAIKFSSTSPSDRIRLVLEDVRLDPVKQCPFPYQRLRRTISTMGLSKEFPKKRSTCDETRVNPHDHVAAYDTDGSLLECLCADADKRVEIVSKGPSLKIVLRLYHIHYLAHREPTAFVFRGKYEAIAAVCGTPSFGGQDGQRLATSGAGEISYRTPVLGNRGYYKNYSGRENATCRWSIEATPGTAVVVKIISLTLPGNCTEASVSFYHEEALTEPYAQLCGGGQSTPVEIMPPTWTSTFQGLHTGNGRVYDSKGPNKISIVFRAKSGAQVFFRLRWSRVRVRNKGKKGEPRCEYQCPDNRTCLAYEQLCDGYIDCPQANFIGDPLDEGPAVCGGQYGSEYFVACLLTASVVSAGVVTSAACAVICLWKKKEAVPSVDPRITRTKSPLITDQPQPSTSRLNSTSRSLS